MTRRMYNEDAYSLGLLYLYKYSNKEQKMALLDDLKKFHQAIENILEENNSKTYNLYRTSGSIIKFILHLIIRREKHIVF